MADVRLPNLIGDNMVLQRDMPVPIWGWADAGETVNVSIDGKSASATAGEDGKWMVKLPAMKAGGPFELVVRGDGAAREITLTNVMVGEVWICCGQSNLIFRVNECAKASEIAAKADYPEIRMIALPRDVASTPREDVEGIRWYECLPGTMSGFSAVGYFFGRDVYQGIDVPVGLIQTGVTDTRVEFYMSPEVLKGDPDFASVYDRWQAWKDEHDLDRDFPDIEENLHAVYHDQRPMKARWQKAVADAKAAGKEAPASPKFLPWRIFKNYPSGQYHAVVRPLMPFGIRGVVWYQGEGNSTTGELYRKLLPTLIESWRAEWGQGDFPFYFVQLPRIWPTRPEWPEVRDAYLHTLRTVKQTGMAVTYDLTTTGDVVHPPDNKDAVGARLALLALKQVYGKDVVCYGPLFKEAVREGDGFRVFFEHTDGGLVARGDALLGFTVAGADQYFHPATARIDGETVVVACAKAAEPVAVRYAWRNNPIGNLFNGAGLPASPFRTDDWPGISSRDITDYGRQVDQVEWILGKYVKHGQLDDAADFLVDWGGDPVVKTTWVLRVAAALLKADRPADAQGLTAHMYYAAMGIEDREVRAVVNGMLKAGVVE